MTHKDRISLHPGHGSASASHHQTGKGQELVGMLLHLHACTHNTKAVFSDKNGLIAPNRMWFGYICTIASRVDFTF